MHEKPSKSILSAYGRKNCLADILEVLYGQLRERVVGIDYKIFAKTIRYYAEVQGKRFSNDQALEAALDKTRHKNAWHSKKRDTIEEKMHFYQEVHIYPFRQPYNKRFGGHRWYRNLVKHITNPSVMEYGCGAAVLTEYLSEKFPDLKYTVADIPSVTLDFVRWKKKAYGYPYDILTIGKGKEGIPLVGNYDLIICRDVLEHTPNPLDIVESFVEHLSQGGVLVVDFLNAPGGENLAEAEGQRDQVKLLLKERLIALKAIDEPRGNDGLYVKDVDSALPPI